MNNLLIPCLVQPLMPWPNMVIGGGLPLMPWPNMVIGGGLPQTCQALRFNGVSTFGRLAVTLFIISVIEHNSYDNT